MATQDATQTFADILDLAGVREEPRSAVRLDPNYAWASEDLDALEVLATRLQGNPATATAATELLTQVRAAR